MALTLAEQIAGRCVHFTGTQHGACGAGVVYVDICGGDDPGWARRLPCLKNLYPDEPKASCSSAKFRTAEEAQAAADATFARLRARAEAIARGDRPDCGARITLRQIGPCVYGSCGHRLYHGHLPRRSGA